MSTDLDSDLAFAGPVELAERLRRGELKARELVELYLRRIEALDPRLNAFRVTLPDEALAAADALDSRGFDDVGPLAGIPIAIKDDVPVAGQLMSYGSRSPTRPQLVDAEPIRRLRAAGAIPIGITGNPWDPSRTPGGSSGGSAAATAAGLVADGRGAAVEETLYSLAAQIEAARPWAPERPPLRVPDRNIHRLHRPPV